MAVATTNNPNFSQSEYSVWERMCAERFKSMSRQLLARGADALPEIRDTIVQIDANTEFFDEIFKVNSLSSASKLTKSKIELLTESHKLGIILSNLNSAKITLSDRVKMQHRLADVTLDVNHILGAMIYLTKAFADDLQSLQSA